MMNFARRHRLPDRRIDLTNDFLVFVNHRHIRPHEADIHLMRARVIVERVQYSLAPSALRVLDRAWRNVNNLGNPND
jgi:hypothetical protein